MSSDGSDASYAATLCSSDLAYEDGQVIRSTGVQVTSEFPGYGNIFSDVFNGFNNAYGFSSSETPDHQPTIALSVCNLEAENTALNEESNSLNPFERQMSFSPVKKEPESSAFALAAEAIVTPLLDFPDELMLNPSIAQIVQLHSAMTATSDTSASPGAESRGSHFSFTSREKKDPMTNFFLSPGTGGPSKDAFGNGIQDAGHVCWSAPPPSMHDTTPSPPACPSKNWRQKSLPKSSLIIACPFMGCAKMFAKTSNLRAHVRLHTGEKPYACSFPGCSKRFMWMSALKPHERMHEKKTKRTSYRTPEEIEAEKIFHCSFCERRFARKTSLTNHERSHLNARKRQPSEDKKISKSKKAPPMSAPPPASAPPLLSAPSPIAPPRSAPPPNAPPPSAPPPSIGLPTRASWFEDLPTASGLSDFKFVQVAIAGTQLLN